MSIPRGVRQKLPQTKAGDSKGHEKRSPVSNQMSLRISKLALKSKHDLLEAPTELNGVTLKFEPRTRRPVCFPYRPRFFAKRDLVAYDLIPDGFLEASRDEAWKARKLVKCIKV
jgi:hypothetical protein